MAQKHIMESEAYKRLANIHIKLTVNKDYRHAFEDFLLELEKDESRIPKTYEELETVYGTFSTKYAKTHH
jgi:DNA-binding TFAR19-related protein (PDSD5 family)